MTTQLTILWLRGLPLSVGSRISVSCVCYRAPAWSLSCAHPARKPFTLSVPAQNLLTWTILFARLLCSPWYFVSLAKSNYQSQSPVKTNFQLFVRRQTRSAAVTSYKNFHLMMLTFRHVNKVTPCLQKFFLRGVRSSPKHIHVRAQTHQWPLWCRLPLSIMFCVIDTHGAVPLENQSFRTSRRDLRFSSKNRTQ